MNWSSPGRHLLVNVTITCQASRPVACEDIQSAMTECSAKVKCASCVGFYNIFNYDKGHQQDSRIYYASLLVLQLFQELHTLKRPACKIVNAGFLFWCPDDFNNYKTSILGLLIQGRLSYFNLWMGFLFKISIYCLKYFRIMYVVFEIDLLLK